MIRPTLIGLAAFSAMVLPASADADLAEAWGARAAELHADTLALRSSGTMPADYVVALSRFAVTAGRLGHWMEQAGEGDLGCIFRGMAEEAEIQLYAMEQPSERAQAVERLTVLFDDAQFMSAAAASAARRAGTAPAASAPTCEADVSAARQYLTEQP